MALTEPDPVWHVLPLHGPVLERTQGGQRFRVTPKPCRECGSLVAVPHKLWRESLRDGGVQFLCEPCASSSSE